MSFGEKYAQAFWPLAALPLFVVGVGVVVLLHASFVAVVALAVLVVDAALGEALIWRGLQAKWSGERDSLWPWSRRLLTGLQVVVAFTVMVAAGSWKAQGIEQGTWPRAVLMSALCSGGLLAIFFVVGVVDHWRNGVR